MFHDARLDRWFVTRHALVRACLRDRRLGRGFLHLGGYDTFKATPPDARWSAFWDVERHSLLWLKPPAHTRLRKLVAAAFTPRAVESLRAPAEQLADGLLEPLLNAGRMELLRDFAQPYSIGVICRLLGVQQEHSRDLLDWSHAIVKMYEFETSDADAGAAEDAAAAFCAAIHALIEERARQPRDDMVTALVEARVDGERLGRDEIVSTVVLLLNAGHEATVNTLGNGLSALMHHPEEWRRLVTGEVPAAAAVEELIRYDPPLQLFERWVLEDGFEIAGIPIPRGDQVALLFGAANRDPRAFTEPDRFDLTRPNADQHIGFGGGIHVCIGAPLARLELATSLALLAERCPAMELVEEPRRNRAFVIWGLEGVELALA